MRTKSLVLVPLASVVLLTFAVAAAPAGAGVGGLPQVGNPEVAHLHLYDAHWWSGGYGWVDGTACPPGTPIPAQDFIIAYGDAYNPDRSLVEQFPQIFSLSLTVKAANGDMVVMITQEQSAQFWGRRCPSGRRFTDVHGDATCHRV
jgi:hypothetical protein